MSEESGKAETSLRAGTSAGELRRFEVRARVILVLCGVALAVFFNLVRNTILVLIANYYGAAVLERWHDSAGWSILGVSFIFLLLIARSFGKPAEIAESKVSFAGRLPAWMGGGLAVWFLLVIAGNEAWYSAHERDIVDGERLKIHWPRGDEHFRAEVISDRARDITLCSEAENATWIDGDGKRWIVTSLRWAAGRTASQSARIHQPDVCLQASGALPVMQLPPVELQADGGKMYFHVWLFQYAGRPLYVFYNLWEEANRDQFNIALQQDWSAWSRVQRALIGQRNLGQQSVEIAIGGCDSQEAAIEAVRASLPALVSIIPR